MKSNKVMEPGAQLGVSNMDKQRDLLSHGGGCFLSSKCISIFADRQNLKFFLLTVTYQ